MANPNPELTAPCPKTGLPSTVTVIPQTWDIPPSSFVVHISCRCCGESNSNEMDAAELFKRTGLTPLWWKEQG